MRTEDEAALQKLLSRTFLFQGVPETALEEMLADRRTLRQQAEKGEVIYDPRHFQRCLGVVLEGTVQVNKGNLIMSVLRQGDLFGAAALFDQHSGYATTLTARTRCRLLLLPQALMEEWMERWPQVGRNYVTYLSQRIWFLSGKIDALTAGTAQRKLAQYLLAHERDGEVALDCSLTGLAGRLGVSRASLYRALDELRDQGTVSHQGRAIRILDQRGLTHMQKGSG
ncbi:Crp/Fnr family transcriptional regulator [uncultured Flavonifractor sp.]|uniref:Crp/Fnr family transcriptional regulator n=1 Tax=uncultured Flavonifractor sp. TaxID=1193534 RepID=UPI002628D835|nr:Crp/Fnr family transcriptional regulator [uncultured Flavonifractor sp.]